jgi:hypothetical protein
LVYADQLRAAISVAGIPGDGFSGHMIKRKNPGALKEIYERLSTATKTEIAVGFPAGKAQAYPDGTPVALVAAFNVFGTKDIPSRDFMALAKSAIIEKTSPIMAEIGRLELEGKDKEVDALRQAAGIAGADAIKAAIIALDSPPNAPGTIMKKKSSNPLIDTSHMKDSVTFVIRERTDQ